MTNNHSRRPFWGDKAIDLPLPKDSRPRSNPLEFLPPARMHTHVDVSSSINATSIEYDPEKGELIEKINGTIAELMQVRMQLKEKTLRQAVIIELERLGYTVISPEVQP